MWTPRRISALDGPGARRVVMVLESVFPSPGSGGAEGQVLTLGRHLVVRGMQVVVVVPLVAKGPPATVDETEGLAVIRIPYPRIPKIGGVVLAIRLAWLLWARRRGYAAIHAHIANTMAAVCCLVGRAAGRTVVVKLTGALELNRGILDPRQRRLPVRVLRWALRRATAYQAVSARIGGLLPVCGFDGSRVRVIPNAVDTERFRPEHGASDVRRRLGLGHKRVGVFVGRFTHEKAVGLLLRAWAGVFRPDHEVALLLVGDGPLDASLRQACHALDFASQAQFLGSQPDVRPVLAAADFAVLPSTFEGLSNALLEYMAAGLPVIGSRVSGTEDFVRHGENGWLFEASNQGDLERCLDEAARFHLDTLRAMGQRGRALVAANAAVPEVAERLAALYGLPLDPLPFTVAV